MPSFKKLHGEPTLDTSDEPVVYHGEELTDERADEIAAATLAEIRKRNLVPGRKSLTGGTTTSPQVVVRVPADVKVRLDAQAKREGVTLSVLARKAFEEYLSGAG
ncbi:ribbon-helix-helix domain-containing protein [Tomitella gaofuii]|uniref:ribbon-helix-helix domain-containing protein n=1 Tax=Tomitella gaofuii TaxID=2760083 RepID=UPI0015FBCFB3|nr:hypothetical protein [Tomitella gaofuii]